MPASCLFCSGCGIRPSTYRLTSVPGLRGIYCLRCLNHGCEFPRAFAARESQHFEEEAASSSSVQAAEPEPEAKREAEPEPAAEAKPEPEPEAAAELEAEAEAEAAEPDSKRSRKV